MTSALLTPDDGAFNLTN